MGGHFPPESNDDSLPWTLYKSFFYGLRSEAHCLTGCMQRPEAHCLTDCMQRSDAHRLTGLYGVRGTCNVEQVFISPRHSVEMICMRQPI